MMLTDGSRHQTSELSGIADDLVHAGVICECGGDWWSVNFCGIAFVGNMLVVCMPKCWSAAPNVVPSASLLTRVLLRYREENLEEERDNATLMGEGPNLSLVLALRILEDYRAHGLIRRSRRVERVNGNGRVKWGKTTNRKMPVISGGSVFFPELVTAHTLSDASEPLCQVHAQVVGMCVDEIGWLLGVERSPQMAFAKRNAAEMLAVLSRESVRTFSNRELEIIALMQAYLDGAGKRGHEEPMLFGTKSFHSVWEHACARVFGNDGMLAPQILPQPRWNVSSVARGHVFDKKVRQVPDTLSLIDDLLLVIDAKYYDTSVSLPGWQDIVKQLYYRDSIERKLCSDGRLKERLGIERVSNVFVMPGPINTGIQHIGCTEIEQLGADKGWGMVESYSVDVRECLKHYYAGQTSRVWMREISAISWPMAHQASV